MEILTSGRIVRIDEHAVIGAIEIHRLTQLSFWDALIVQAAKIANASVIYSEDMGHGQVVSGVEVRNPFL